MSSVFFFNYTFFCYCTALAVTCGWYCVFILFLFWCDRPRTSLLSRCTWPRWECTTSWRTMSSRQVVLLLLVFSKHTEKVHKFLHRLLEMYLDLGLCLAYTLLVLRCLLLRLMFLNPKSPFSIIQHFLPQSYQIELQTNLNLWQ